MPYRKFKKSFKRKSSRRYRRRRTARIPRMRLKSPTYYFKRHVDFGYTSLSRAAVASQGFSFQLNEVPGYTEFTNLFDIYKIAAVQVRCYTSVNTAVVAVGAAIPPFFPLRWATVIDVNSSGAFTTFDDAREFGTCRVYNFLDMRTSKTRYIRHPRFITGIEEDGNTIVAGGTSTGWLNTVRSDIPHYGYRYIFEQFNDPTAQLQLPQIGFEAIYYLKFRRTK